MTSKLKEAREKSGYTIDDVAEALKIRRQYIIDLEEGNLDDIPAQVYVDGYTQMYHKFLGLPYKNKRNKFVNAPKLPKTKKYMHKYMSTKYIVLLSACMLISVIALYIFFTLPIDDSTENMNNYNDNNEATTN